jgi:ABC-type microcin C transport system permease subunit YejE
MGPVKRISLLRYLELVDGLAWRALCARHGAFGAQRDYVEDARALGQSDLRIIVRIFCPRPSLTSIIAATMSVPGYILGEAAFPLNLGIRDPGRRGAIC